MAGDATITIDGGFQRLDAATVEAFAGTPSGFLADALGRRGALDPRIRPVWDGPAFVGSALPVWTTARDNLAPYAALKATAPGDVIVVGIGDDDGAAVVGDIIIGMYRNAGAVAVVTDGLVRDVPGIREVGLPVHARGVTPNSPFKNGPGTVGLPIAIGGVTVEPGDLVLGDSDGVVVCPGRRVGEALEALKAIRAKEAKMEAAVKAGLKLPDWLEATLAEKGCRHLR